MPVKLYVEELTPDKMFGMTSNQGMMLENANRIRVTDKIDPTDLAALVFQAGRYVAVVAQDTHGILGMMFFDLKKNKDLAEKMATQFEEDLKRAFMKNFYEVTKNYDKNYNLVELEVNQSFPSDPSAN